MSNSNSGNLSRDLREHLALCRELLLLAGQENQSLRTLSGGSSHEFQSRRQRLLPLLDESLLRLKTHRLQWQPQVMTGRRLPPEIARLIHEVQDLIMKVLMLDRENEQILLRRGVMPPFQSPPAACQRPHFVTDLYLRHGPA